MRLFLSVLLMVAGLCLTSAGYGLSMAAPMTGEGVTARTLFGQLPLTIFENTPEGLSAEERDRLLECNAAGFWVIEEESYDHLTLQAQPFEDQRVVVRVFRGGEHGFIVGIGTMSQPISALELWGFDGTGGLVPIDTPPAPPITDFFAQGVKLSKGISPALLFALTDDGLVVRALFWGSSGLVNIATDYNVHYIWKNGIFHKEITPVHP